MSAVAAEPAKKVAWIELFFDLVFVYAVTRCAEMIRDDLSWAGVGAAAIAFVPLYWTWVGVTMNANLHSVDDAFERIGTFAVALCSLGMALALPEAFHGSGVFFGASYWAARLVLLALVTKRENRRAFVTFTVAACVTGPLLLIGGFAHGHWRPVIWAVAALIDLSIPHLARRRLATVPFDVAHLTERYGTLVIIALGETIVATAAGAEHHDAAHLVALALAFVVTCSLWWVYFAFGPDVIEESLRAREARIDLIRPVLSYGHLCLIAGIIGFATAIEEAVAEPATPLTTAVVTLLYGGVALYLLTFAFTRWSMVHTLAVPRLVAVGCVLVLLVLCVHLDATWQVGLLAAVLVALNTIEHRVLPRTL